ncbi:DUF2140 family protein [Alicyclobacillus macrosporangiidus]|uniref:Uncharacterized protein YpmS n=1 Tax=Alicyclobacillus macrosporangiidus TaxID=392015 RepID=A0A1I7K2X9_9BACL|nr:DUF2140 family protein [Alicyclobacillus macrosporangiidus]SFU91749.1 Uncharacterized protein YpmS [Alicyclobacillus macrosporangiidus]
MWKRAFIALLSVNLAVLALLGLWWGSLPKAGSVPAPVPAAGEKAATFQLALDQDAINTYLEYAVSEQPDLKAVLAYARVQFDDRWRVQLGFKLQDRVVPADVVFTPSISGGDVTLHMESATVGALPSIPVPESALFFVFKHLPWPNWIGVDAEHADLQLHLSQRPQRPYGVQVIGYDPAQKLLTLRVSILPKSLLSAKGGTG